MTRKAQQGFERLLFAGRDPDDDDIGFVVDPIEGREKRAVVAFMDETQRLITQGRRAVGPDGRRISSSVARVITGRMRSKRAREACDKLICTSEVSGEGAIGATKLQMWIGQFKREHSPD